MKSKNCGFNIYIFYEGTADGKTYIPKLTVESWT
jgi:hypothetical protein